MSGLVLRGALRKKKDTYGFLSCDDGSDDCFMLPTAFVDGTSYEALTEGQRLEFEPYDHVDPRTGQPRGRRARNVRLIES